MPSMLIEHTKSKKSRLCDFYHRVLCNGCDTIELQSRKSLDFPLHFGRAQCFWRANGIFDAWPTDSPIIATPGLKGDSFVNCSLVTEHCGCWKGPKFDRHGRRPLEQPTVCHPKVSGQVHEICTDGPHGPCWMICSCGGGCP